MTASWTQDDIAALVDGSLEGPAAERVRAALAADPGAAAVAARLTEERALLRAAFAAPLAEPVPPALAQTILTTPGRVIAFPARPARSWRPVALAASAALAVGLGLGLGFGGPGAGPLVAVGPVDARSALHATLETRPSGAAGSVRPMSSFRDATGRICREFEVDGTIQGLACRDAAGWQVTTLIAGPATTPPDGFAPASGDPADPLSAVLDALGAGPPLPPDAEAALLARGWR